MVRLHKPFPHYAFGERWTTCRDCGAHLGDEATALTVCPGRPRSRRETLAYLVLSFFLFVLACVAGIVVFYLHRLIFGGFS